MGKSRKQNKFIKTKDSPTGMKSVKDFENELQNSIANSNSDKTLQLIMEQLQLDPDNKANGIQALSTLIKNEHNIQAIIKTGVIRIIGPFLTDADHNIRNAVSGAIRNLSAISVEICENLVENDVLTPLLILLNQYNDKDWVPKFDKDKNQLDVRSDTFLQCVHILLNLCESTEVALEILNDSNLYETFMRCLNPHVFGLEISVAVGQCFLVISEDNSPAWKFLNNFSEELISLSNTRFDEETDKSNYYLKVMFKTVIAGICSNVPNILIKNITTILSSLSKTIEINHRQILGSLSSSLPLLDTENVQEIEVSDDTNQEMEVETDRPPIADPTSELEKQVTDTKYLILAQRIAAEVLSNICCPDDDDSSQMEEDSDTDSMHEMEFSMTKDTVPPEVSEAITTLGIVENLWSRAQPLPENVSQILKESKSGLANRVVSLRVSTLLCLHNFCNILSTEDLGGPEAIYNVWLDLGHQLFNGTSDDKTVEAITALMRATLDHLKNDKNLFQQMTIEDLQLILNGLKNCNNIEIRANWLKMLGLLGCLVPEHLVKVIFSFILEAIAKEQDVWVLSEAIDAFMDMFSDNDWDAIVCELKIAQQIGELDKILKSKMHQQKRELGERYAAVSTVKTNLSRFYKYLLSQQKKYAVNKRA